VPRIDGLFDELAKRGGSDLHLAAGYPPLARVRGDLVALREAAIEASELDETLAELLTPVQRARLAADLDLDFAHTHKGQARFRANYFTKASGIGAVFRLVPTRVLTLAELGCPEVLWRLADRRSGLVIVTGPTGSGKSTTLAAMVDHINKTRACHIVTIEDPVEFVHEPLRAQITHREVGVHTPTFAAAMRTAGRENPDVVVVGELRTPETVKLALQLASSGVLVFATAHTNGAAPTLERMVSSFPAEEQSQIRGMLAEALAGLVAQQLLVTPDGKGRVAVHEILIGSPAVSALVRENKSGQLTSVMQAGQAQGMQTMDMALERLLTQNKIAAEDALDSAVDREMFAQVIARVRPDLAEILG
jgi:twitching motility protein PilT